MKTTKKINEGIRVAKEGIEECWDDMGGQTMTQGNGEQMSVTISMPGKNISVTTDSAEEIGSILRLAGINIGGGGVAGDVDGDGDHDLGDHAAELAGGDAEQVLYVGAGNPEEGPAEMPEPSDHEEDEEEQREAVGDTTTTHKGGTVTQTATGQVHKAGPGSYGGSDKEDEDEPSSMYKQSAIPDKEVEESKKPDDDGDGVPNWADKHEGKDDQEFEESARILALAGVTNEAQSAAQKAAFKAMIDKKNGKSDDAGSDASDDMASDKEEEVKEEAPATDSMFGQGVFEGDGEAEAARIVALAGLDEARLMNAPDGTSMPEPAEYTIANKLGKGAGHRDYGQNRANNQGENPMGMHTADIDSVEEAFQTAMGEYRKFVAENIARKK